MTPDGQKPVEGVVVPVLTSCLLRFRWCPCFRWRRSHTADG